MWIGRVSGAWTVLFLVSASAAVAEGTGGAELERSPAGIEIAEKLARQSGTSSVDGSVRIAGECLNAVDRQILMQFTQDVRGLLEQLTNTSFTGDPYRILIYAEAGEADRPGVAGKHLMDPSIGARRMPTIRITLINPSKLDPRDLAREICDGLVRMKVLAAAAAGKVSEPPAGWFTSGLAHYLDNALRQKDADEVFDMWQHAQLQPLWMLPREHSQYPSADRRIAAQLVAYWLDFPDRGKRFETLCRALASGEKWSPALFVETSSGSPDMVEADKAFDEWLLKRRNTVLTLGTTSRGMLVRASRAMLLTPGEDFVPDDIPASAPPAVLAEHLGEKWTADCAKAKLEKIMRLSAGRGDKFRKAADEYAEYFNGVIRREPKDKLLDKLRLAEEMLRDGTESPR